MAAATKETKTNPTEEAINTAEDFSAAARDQFEAMMTTFTASTEDMREQAEEMTGEIRARFEKSQETAAKINAEIVNAAQAETADAVQFVTNLGQAKTFADALEVQQSYWTNLFETRMERTRKLTETSVEAARENFAPVKSPFTAMFDTNAFADLFRAPSKA